MTLIKYKPETEQALKDDRVRRFVFFDFMFLPKRVHDGDSTIEWTGTRGLGIGETLAEGFSAQQTSVVGGPPPIGGSTIGSLTASLPLDKELSEVLAKGYYRQGSKMTWMLCAMDESGHGVIERVAITGPYTITQHTTKGNLVTFTSVDEMWGARKDVDEKRKDDKDFIRQSFKWALAGGGTSMALGMTLNSVVALTVNWFGFAVDLALFLLPSRRRALLQRVEGEEERLLVYNRACDSSGFAAEAWLQDSCRHLRGSEGNPMARDCCQGVVF